MGNVGQKKIKRTTRKKTRNKAVLQCNQNITLDRCRTEAMTLNSADMKTKPNEGVQWRQRDIQKRIPTLFLSSSLQGLNKVLSFQTHFLFTLTGTGTLCHHGYAQGTIHLRMKIRSKTKPLKVYCICF